MLKDTCPLDDNNQCRCLQLNLKFIHYNKVGSLTVHIAFNIYLTIYIYLILAYVAHACYNSMNKGSHHPSYFIKLPLLQISSVQIKLEIRSLID